MPTSTTKSLRYLLLSCLLLLLLPNNNNHWAVVTIVQAEEDNGQVDVFMDEPLEDMTTNTNLTDDDTTSMELLEDDMIMIPSNNDTNGTEFPSAAPSMMPTEVPTLEGGVTEDCLQETNAFTENPVLSQELEALFESYRQEFQVACPFSITSNGCDLTFGSDPNITYNDLCRELGGQIYEHSVTLQCGVAPLDVRYDLGFVPQCIGGGCNITKIENAGVLRSSNISDFGSSLDNGACRANVESSAYSALSVGMLRSMAVVGVASFALPTFVAAIMNM